MSSIHIIIIIIILQHYIINWYDMLYHRANRRRRIKSLLLINTTRQYWLGPAWTYNWLPSYASKSTFIYPKFTHFISTAQHCAMWGHVGRVVKALDSKSIGLCPRRFKSCTGRVNTHEFFYVTKLIILMLNSGKLTWLFYVTKLIVFP